MNSLKYPLFFLFILLFSSLAFASVLWTFETNGPVTTRPLAVGSDIAFGSQDGFFYMVSGTGSYIWKKQLGNYILQPVQFGDNLVVVTTNGRLVELTRDGTIVRDIKISKSIPRTNYIYGIAAHSTNRLYITTNNAIVALNKTGDPYVFYKIIKNASVLTPPSVAYDGTVLFGVDDELYAVKDSLTKWKKKIDVVWRSRPLVSGNVVYQATLGNSLYAYDISTGSLIWKKEIEGWVTSDLLLDGQTIYFGTTKGNVYAIDSVTGGIVWKKSLPAGFGSTPSRGQLGGKEALFLGSDDSNLYVFDAINGKIIWKWPAGAKVGNTLFHHNKILVPSYDNHLYALSSESACFITSPEEGSVLGPKEVVISGSVISSSPKSVYVRTEGGNWVEAISDDAENWHYVLDPTPLPPGIIVVECKVGSAESEPSFSYVLSLDKNIPLSTFSVNYPSTVKIDQEFVISVFESGTNIPVENFTLIVDGKTYHASGNITLKLSQEGKSKITVKKIGYQEANFTIDVKKTEFDIVPIAVIVLVLLVLVYFYFFIYKRK